MKRSAISCSLHQSAYRSEGSTVRIELETHLEDNVATVNVVNDGPQIPEDQHKCIFFYRNSDRKTAENKGIGLFSARAYLLGMDATISVGNRKSGVAFVLIFPLLTKAEVDAVRLTPRAHS